MMPIAHKNAKGTRFVFVFENGAWSVLNGVTFETIKAGFQSVVNAKTFAEQA